MSFCLQVYEVPCYLDTVDTFKLLGIIYVAAEQ